MRFILFAFFVTFSAATLAGPVWNYELRGEVSQLADPTIYGEKVGLGNEFSLAISIQSLGGGILDVSGSGRVGALDLSAFFDNRTEYIFGDLSPERLVLMGIARRLANMYGFFY